jgi:ferritin
VKVTGLINKLAELAAAENDHATGVFLQWFIKEQVEEEASADAIVQKLKLAKDSSGALLMLDRELGKRKAGSDD